jgi:hypothetical protein
MPDCGSLVIDYRLADHVSLGMPRIWRRKVIRNVEPDRCGNMQQPEQLSERRPEDFPPLVLPSAADLDSYVAMVADEERIRGLTSK